MNMSVIKAFFAPRITRRYMLRVILVGAGAALFFGFVCRPCVIQGESMRPTYPASGFLFCWKPSFWFAPPRRGQTAIVRFVGHNVFLLKRIVALEGDTVEFKEGVLLVNGHELNGNWETLGPSNWNLPPRIVEKAHVYVVGDNRSMDMDSHVFGQLPAKRLMGTPLW